MADAPQQDEAPDRCGNPFDSKTSDRTPFPSFDAALANNQPTDEAQHQDTGSALDWSIDTLAELKPVTFSPLPQQKDGANSAETPRGTSSFFEDEKQDTIARCEAALRERQHKMDKLQTVLPPPTSKSPLIQQLTPNSEWLSPNMRPPKWSASPIAVVGKRPFCATPVMLHFDAMTPLSNISRSTTPKQSSKVRLSFGLSPISFPSPRHAQEEEKEEENSEEKPNAPSNEDTLPLGSSEESAASVSKKENRDNRDQQAHSEGERQHEDSSSSHGTSSPTMRTPTAKKTSAVFDSAAATASLYGGYGV
ncbi:Hypothetical protein PHPALM_12549 [Phytophthora palmivora]|uniref:Uncharacterized protein n=1 Tax=Phytophthora palmivora TaxID=4796 RepID=A0A2P4XZH3_9STRA|nr:Hypothetical protein PHPALM_12549 [Phytophthora palmivora]